MGFLRADIIVHIFETVAEIKCQFAIPEGILQCC